MEKTMEKELQVFEYVVIEKERCAGYEPVVHTVLAEDEDQARILLGSSFTTNQVANSTILIRPFR